MSIKRLEVSEWRKDGEAWGRARTNLYVVQEGDDGPLKVGVAGHPVRRLMMLQTGNHRKLYLRAVYEGHESKCVAVERYILAYFESIGGEWFLADLNDVIKVIDAFSVPS